MPRLAAVRRHWRVNPPLHALVAAFLEYHPPAEEPVAITAEALRAYARETGIDLPEGL